MRTLLTSEQIEDGLARIAREIVEQPTGTGRLVLIGVRRGGIPIVARLAQLLRENGVVDLPVGSVDITLYRDDAATALPNPRIGPSDIPCSLDRTRVVLVDDVLHTRRTIRAAIDALMDYGRPENIELMVIVDRRGRQLPIQPDYSVIRVEDVDADERIDVFHQDGALTAVVQSSAAPSIPPPDVKLT